MDQVERHTYLERAREHSDHNVPEEVGRHGVDFVNHPENETMGLAEASREIGGETSGDAVSAHTSHEGRIDHRQFEEPKDSWWKGIVGGGRFMEEAQKREKDKLKHGLPGDPNRFTNQTYIGKSREVINGA